MGRHREWRRIAKKHRRKRKRTERAIERDKLIKIEQSCPTYIKHLEKQQELEKFQEEEEARISKEHEAQWLKTEEEAQKQWKQLQEKLEKIKEERLKEEARILEEWKREQQKVVEAKERRKQLLEENERKQTLIREKIDEFISYGGDIPAEFKVSIETNPNKEACPFFTKTSACRFKDVCSRNHIRPGISKVLLFPNFYSHFSLQQVRDCEYGSDLSLEHDDRETYKHFLSFFEDVLKELETYGHVTQFKVCKNTEPHLRGNVYVEYRETREALRAFRELNGRWYAGKKLNCEFCNIVSWKAAICGLNYGRKCPKGNLCNFLHVFHNPGNLFRDADRDLHRQDEQPEDEDEEYNSRSWRWSESPERNNDEKENHSNKRQDRQEEGRRRRRRSHHHHHHHHEHRKKHKRTKSPNLCRKRKRKRTSHS